jgi:hypothetical protein
VSGNLAASTLARLLTLAKQRGEDYSVLLNRLSLERLLLRLSKSSHANRFLLKGALLFALWYDDPRRPTRDADLLGFGPGDEANLLATFRDIAAMDLDDGIVFDPQSVSERPLALTREFSEDAAKERQWQAFQNKNRITSGSLGDTVSLLDFLLWPPTQVAASNSQASARWRPESGRWE